jgi:hypothetical protein
VPAGVQAGDLIDRRYRLDQHCHTVGERALWRATDEVLGRSVAIHLLGASTRSDAKALAAAAGRAGSVPDARWVRVLDVGTIPAGRSVVVWIVSEWVEGQTLTSLIRREPLREPVAAFLVASCAQAVSAAQRAGACHGRLHPDEVLIPADGWPRLTGLEIHQSLSGEQLYDDVLGLGALLFAAVTGRWPLRGWAGLPPVSRGDGRHPRTQRRRVSRQLDDVVAAALDGGYADAEAMARALARLPQVPLARSAEEPDSPRRERLQRISWRVVPPLLVAGVGLAAWSAGSDLGRIPGANQAPAPDFPQPHARGVPGTRLVWTTPPTATSFDPEGNGTEDPGGVGLALDDDPSTAWTTDTYHGSPRFGGLKQGVGLLVDLGRPKTVRTARLLLSAPGADIELRAGPNPPASPDDLPLVASRSTSPASLTLQLTSPVRARYWLVWITSLPRVGSDSYALGISEFALLH